MPGCMGGCLDAWVGRWIAVVLVKVTWVHAPTLSHSLAWPVLNSCTELVYG